MRGVLQTLLAGFCLLPGCNKAPAPVSTPVVVVGGGLAGLVTAYELQRYGITAHVLEERSVWGGRVATANYENNLAGEYGMQEIWQDNPLLRIAQELGVATDTTGEPAFSSTVLDGRLYPFVQDSPAAYLASLFNEAERQALRAWQGHAAQLYHQARTVGLLDSKVAVLQDLSLAGWLEKSGLPPRVVAWLRLTLECELASEGEGVSALSALLDMEMFFADGLTNYQVQGGNQKVIDALVKALKGPHTLGAQVYGIVRTLDVKGKPLLRVAYEKDHRMRELQAEHVVLAVPFFRVHQVNIEPSLPPDYWNAINSLHLGQYTMVHLITNTRARALWAHPGSSLFPVLAGGTLGVVYGPHGAADDGRDVFRLLIYGQPARRFHMVPREIKVAEIQAGLERLWPGLRALTEASYVYNYHPSALPVWPPGRSAIDPLAQTLRTPHMGLHLAGDYTRGAHATAAVQSGVDVALEIARAMGRL